MQDTKKADLKGWVGVPLGWEMKQNYPILS